MRLKTFTAATMAQAMAQIRGELGEDAIIISTETASAAAGAFASSPRSTRRTPDEDGFVGLDARQQPAAPAAPESEVERRACVPRRAGGARATSRPSGGDAARARDDAPALAAALDGTLGFQPMEDRLAPRPLMLVGPPGVGKTTVAAKLIVAAHRRGRKVVARSPATPRAPAASSSSRRSPAFSACRWKRRTRRRRSAAFSAPPDGSRRHHRHRRRQPAQHARHGRRLAGADRRSPRRAAAGAGGGRRRDGSRRRRRRRSPASAAAA